ncbi:hypothetical protein GCM10008940_34440 [Microbulbifer agarilyticus]
MLGTASGVMNCGKLTLGVPQVACGLPQWIRHTANKADGIVGVTGCLTQRVGNGNNLPTVIVLALPDTSGSICQLNGMAITAVFNFLDAAGWIRFCD